VARRRGLLQPAHDAKRHRVASFQGGLDRDHIFDGRNRLAVNRKNYVFLE
jgi:hypothetical protein